MSTFATPFLASQTLYKTLNIKLSGCNRHSPLGNAACPQTRTFNTALGGQFCAPNARGAGGGRGRVAQQQRRPGRPPCGRRTRHAAASGPRNPVLRGPSIPRVPPPRATSGVAGVGGWRRSGRQPLALTPSRALGQHGGRGGGTVLREPPEWRPGSRRQGRGSCLHGWGGSQEKKTKEEEG